MKTRVITLLWLFLACTINAAEKDPILEWYEQEYAKRYREAVNSGKVDLEDKDIPKDIRNKPRAVIYYRAGFVRGVFTRLSLSGYKSGEGLGHYYRSVRQGVFYYEAIGWEAGCRAANAVAGKIHTEVKKEVFLLLKRRDLELHKSKPKKTKPNKTGFTDS